MTPIDNTRKGSIHRQCIISFVASTMILTYGLQSGWMSPAITVLQSENSPSGYPLSSSEISLIASFIGVFATPTGVIFSYVSDAIGRRKTLLILVMPQILGFALKLASAHPITLMVAQACCGVAGGAMHGIVPTYLKEISQDSLRGVLGSLGLLLQCLGILLMYAMGAYMDYYTILWIVVWIPVLNLLALLKVPETPAYLVKKGRVEEATEIMAWLRGVNVDEKDVERDISMTISEMAAYENVSSVSYKSLFATKATQRALGLSFLLVIILDGGGNYAILSYASVIIRNAGVTVSPDLQTIAFPALMALGTLASAFTVDKFGRKPLIISSVLLTGVPLAILASMLLVQDQGGPTSSLISVVCIGICLFASGQTLPVPYIVMPEMFSVQTAISCIVTQSLYVIIISFMGTSLLSLWEGLSNLSHAGSIQLRSKVLGLLATFGWLLSAFQTAVFTTAVEYLGMYTIFYIFACVNFFGAIVCYLKMPETKGKTLAQIEEELDVY